MKILLQSDFLEIQPSETRQEYRTPINEILPVSDSSYVLLIFLFSILDIVWSTYIFPGHIWLCCHEIVSRTHVIQSIWVLVAWANFLKPFSVLEAWGQGFYIHMHNVLSQPSFRPSSKVILFERYPTEDILIFPKDEGMNCSWGCGVRRGRWVREGTPKLWKPVIYMKSKPNRAFPSTASHPHCSQKFNVQTKDSAKFKTV